MKQADMMPQLFFALPLQCKEHGRPVVLRMFPDSPVPVFMATKHMEAEGYYAVRPLTLGSFVLAVLFNFWALNLYRLRWALWRAGFVDISPGEKWRDGRWRWRFWRPRLGEHPVRAVAPKSSGAAVDELSRLDASFKENAARECGKWRN